MLFSKIAFLSGLAAIAAAQDTDFDFSNIPAECTDVCAQVGSITNGCKNDSNDDSSEVLQCICTANRANVLIPNCQACVRQYNGNDNDNDSDNDDSYRLLTDCNYVTTTYNPSLATETVSVTDTNTVTNTDTNTVTNTNTDTVVSTATVMPTGDDNDDDNDDDSNTSNPAAPMKTAGAALGLGAFGIAALGLL